MACSLSCLPACQKRAPCFPEAVKSLLWVLANLQSPGNLGCVTAGNRRDGLFRDLCWCANIKIPLLATERMDLSGALLEHRSLVLVIKTSCRLKRRSAEERLARRMQLCCPLLVRKTKPTHSWMACTGKTEGAEERLARHAGGLLLPPASAEAWQELPPMQARHVIVEGNAWDQSSVDIHIAGACVC
eukprot:1152661-Pelagomonas_calceolata.AAC.4